MVLALLARLLVGVTDGLLGVSSSKQATQGRVSIRLKEMENDLNMKVSLGIDLSMDIATPVPASLAL